MHKPTTVAEYKRLRDEKRRESAELQQSPQTGAWFLLTKADLEGYTLVGKLPQSLVQEGMAAWKQQGKMPADLNTRATKLAAQLENEDIESTLILYRQIIVDNCLEPRIVVNAEGRVVLRDEAGDEAPLDPADAQFIFQYATNTLEGQPDSGVRKSSPRRERRATESRARRAKVQRATVEPVEA